MAAKDQVFAVFVIDQALLNEVVVNKTHAQRTGVENQFSNTCLLDSYAFCLLRDRGVRINDYKSEIFFNQDISDKYKNQVGEMQYNELAHEIGKLHDYNVAIIDTVNGTIYSSMVNDRDDMAVLVHVGNSVHGHFMVIGNNAVNTRIKNYIIMNHKAYEQHYIRNKTPSYPAGDDDLEVVLQLSKLSIAEDEVRRANNGTSVLTDDELEMVLQLSRLTAKEDEDRNANSELTNLTPDELEMVLQLSRMTAKEDEEKLNKEDIQLAEMIRRSEEEAARNRHTQRLVDADEEALRYAIEASRQSYQQQGAYDWEFENALSRSIEYQFM